MKLARGTIAGPLALAVLVSPTARAQNMGGTCDPTVVRSCGQLPAGSLVVTGSRALAPVLRAMSAALEKETGTQIFYLHTDSQCLGARQVVEGLDLSGGADHADELGAPCERCSLPAGTRADMWISDSPVEDCFGGKKPAGFREFAGPIAAYAMVVPNASSERAITMEEAYFVFGFGTAGWKGETVAPWIDARRVLVPSPLFGTRSVWARFLRLPGVVAPDAPPFLGTPDLIKGLERGSPDAVVSGMSSEKLTGPAGIGLTTTQAFDSAPGNRSLASPVRPLAIQSFGQKYAFYADSNLKAFDKRNVRDGRYPFWAPVRLVVKADTTGRPLSSRAESIINYLLEKVSMPGFNVVDAVVAGRLVPTCAMKVQRKTEGGVAGELLPYTPAKGKACGCYMEERLQRGSSGCTPCNEATPCTGDKSCSHGFCE